MADIIGSVLGSGGITGALGDIFGGSSSTSVGGSGTTTETGTVTESLDISEEAITKIITDLLGSADGLASIFGGEQATGLYSSSVAAQEAGDFASKIAGEIAKLRAKRVSEVDKTTSTTSQQTQGQKSGGLLSSVGDTIAGVFGW